MIFYLDTSALIKLYIKEEGTKEVSTLLKSAANMAATSKVAFVETRAAMSRLRRKDFLDKNSYQMVRDAFKQDWNEFLVVELTAMVIEMGAELTEKYVLRGFDAIHLASALILKRQTSLKVVAGCWDARLWDAFQDNMEVVPASRPGRK